MKKEFDITDVSSELAGIAAILNALSDKAGIPNDVESGLYAVTMSIERLIKEIDAQE